MAWLGIKGHDAIVDHFRHVLAAGRLAHTYLYVGPEGIGKRQFAVRMAQSLLCETRPEGALDPCGACPACLQVMAGTHPDLMVVSKPKDKATIPIELLIGSGEKRMREGLCHDLGLKSFSGKRKIAIIDDADFLNIEGANCLLKTLEEPPPRSLLILIATNVQRQLPTILSRSQVLRFAPLPPAELAEMLIAREVVSGRDEAERLASYAEGSLTRAVELADPELWKFRRELLAELSQAPLDSISIGRRLSAFVESAGTEAAARRDRLRQVIGFALEYYRGLLWHSVGGKTVLDPELASALESAGQRRSFDADQACVAIERCLDALAYVDRNVNQATVLEWWLDALYTTFADEATVAA